MFPLRIFPYSRAVAGASPRVARKLVSRTNFGLRWQSSLDLPVQPAKVINEVPSLHLGITNRAANRLGDIYKQSKEILRVTVESGGCHGFQYNLKLIPESEAQSSIDSEKLQQSDEDDFDTVKDVVYVLPESSGKVVIDEQSLKILNDTTLTYTTELIGSTFKITGGNMSSSCGCGSSFGLDEKQ